MCMGSSANKLSALLLPIHDKYIIGDTSKRGKRGHVQKALANFTESVREVHVHAEVPGVVV